MIIWCLPLSKTSCYVSSSCLYNCNPLASCHSAQSFLPWCFHHDAHVYICTLLHFRRITSWRTDGDFQEGKLNYVLASRNTWAHWRGWQDCHPHAAISWCTEAHGMRKVRRPEGQLSRMSHFHPLPVKSQDQLNVTINLRLLNNRKTYFKQLPYKKHASN